MKQKIAFVHGSIPEPDITMWAAYLRVLARRVDLQVGLGEESSVGTQEVSPELNISGMTTIFLYS